MPFDDRTRRDAQEQDAGYQANRHGRDRQALGHVLMLRPLR
jgi:hypothetical protein